MTARGATLWVVGALGVVAALAFHACTSTPEGMDAGMDAAPRDAAARDAPLDARDGALPDPGWVPLEGLEGPCDTASASRPEAFFVPRWEPCDHGITGCQQLVVDPRWTTRSFHSAIGRSHDGERGYFVAALGETPDQLTYEMVASSDGHTHAAWRRTFPDARGTACLSFTALDPAGVVRAVAALSYPDGGLLSQTGPQLLYRAGYDDIAELTRASLDLTSDLLIGNFVQRLSASSTTTAIVPAPSGQVIVYEGDRHEIRGGRDTPLGAASLGFTVHVIGRDVFWHAGNYPGISLILTARIDREATVLHRDAGMGIYDFDTDGRDMIWLEVTEREPSRVLAWDLWTAAHTAEPSEFAPRRVGAVDTFHSGALGQGLFAYSFYDTPMPPVRSVHHVVVVDLADGSRRRYDFPTGDDLWWTVDRPIWVTRDEVAVAIAGTDGERLIRLQLSEFVPDTRPVR